MHRMPLPGEGTKDTEGRDEYQPAASEIAARMVCENLHLLRFRCARAMMLDERLQDPGLRRDDGASVTPGAQSSCIGFVMPAKVVMHAGPPKPFMLRSMGFAALNPSYETYEISG